MKSRLAASISPLLDGTYKRNMRSTFSSRIMNIFAERLHFQVNSRFQSQGLESSSRAKHSSAIEDDDFAELGPQISKFSAKQIKLVTEKPEYFEKKVSCKKKLTGKPAPSGGRPKIKDIISTLGVASPNSEVKLSGRSLVSESPDDTNKASHIEKSHSTSIINIPPKVGLSELIEAISVFGKVSSASFITASDGLRKSRSRAISAGKIALGSQLLQVCPLDAVHLVAVRIKNINYNTTDSEILSTCKSIGGFVGLSKTGKDAIDTFFNVKNDSVRVKLLQALNNTVFHGSRWSANIQVSPMEKDRSKLGFKIFDHLSELKWQHVLKRLHLEDLEMINAGIMHIEDRQEMTRFTVIASYSS
ncbi:hypothetical protein ACJIZ3_016583 [Penstemon smallii]|uniref:Uncharacterized protein n=1 Tax=Penstemon smallii TaxID=265156 RepID=A0ABD3ST39_9LAMI